MSVHPSSRQDALRGNTPRPSVPHSVITHEQRTPALSPAEESLASAVAFHVGEVLGSLAPDQATAARKATAYKGVIAALIAAVASIYAYGRGQVESYGDSRAAAAASAVKAEAKAEEAAAYLEETRQIAATAREVSVAASERVDILDRKLDRLLRLAEAEAR